MCMMRDARACASPHLLYMHPAKSRGTENAKESMCVSKRPISDENYVASRIIPKKSDNDVLYRILFTIYLVDKP